MNFAVCVYAYLFEYISIFCVFTFSNSYHCVRLSVHLCLFSWLFFCVCISVFFASCCKYSRVFWCVRVCMCMCIGASGWECRGRRTVKRGLCVPLLINTMWSSKQQRPAAELPGKDLEYKSAAHNWSELVLRNGQSNTFWRFRNSSRKHIFTAIYNCYYTCRWNRKHMLAGVFVCMGLFSYLYSRVWSLNLRA